MINIKHNRETMATLWKELGEGAAEDLNRWPATDITPDMIIKPPVEHMKDLVKQQCNKWEKVETQPGSWSYKTNEPIMLPNVFNVLGTDRSGLAHCAPEQPKAQRRLTNLIDVVDPIPELPALTAVYADKLELSKLQSLHIRVDQLLEDYLVDHRDPTANIFTEQDRVGYSRTAIKLVCSLPLLMHPDDLRRTHRGPEFAVLRENTHAIDALPDTGLHQIADLIPCHGKPAPLPNPGKQSAPSSSFFFIHGRFYIDRRQHGAPDISEPVRQWLFAQPEKDGGLSKKEEMGYKNVPEEALSMEDFCLDDLTVQLGLGYLFCHDNMCWHQIAVEDMHLTSNLAAQGLPMLTRHHVPVARPCDVCELRPADYRCMYDKLLHKNPGLLCEECHSLLHYDQRGDRLYDWKEMRLPSALDVMPVVHDTSDGAGSVADGAAQLVTLHEDDVDL